MAAIRLLPPYIRKGEAVSSILEQYRISDILAWSKEKALEINHDFQRGNVWKPAARTMLIDTILRQLPIPKVYFRTKINTRTQRAIREIVDGQQRIRAIIDFAEDKFSLSKACRRIRRKALLGFNSRRTN
jgi:hypothetical protein